MLAALWRVHGLPRDPLEATEATRAAADVEWELDVTDSPHDREVMRDTVHDALEPPGGSVPTVHRTELGSSPVRANPESRPATLPSSSPNASLPADEKSEAWTFSPTVPRAIDLHKGAPWSVPAFVPKSGPHAEAPADEQPSTTFGLVEALDAHDVQRGLGRGGPVKMAVEAAAQRTDVVMEGKARFDIAITAANAIHITLAGVDQSFEDWNRLIPAIREQIAHKTVRIPPGAKGLRVIVEVSARWQFPDGTSPSSLGGKVLMTAGGPVLIYRGKVCSLSAVPSLAGIAGHCSPENIGASPVRIVSSYVLYETRL